MVVTRGVEGEVTCETVVETVEADVTTSIGWFTASVFRGAVGFTVE